MSLEKSSGDTDPNNQKSINPYVKVKGNILVSNCCNAEAVYRVSDETIDLVSWCPECLETYPLEWIEKSISDLENEDMKLHKDNQEIDYNEPYDLEEIKKVKYPHYEDVLKVLDGDEYYDGCYDDLLPWTFSLSDFQHPDREIDLLVDLWNGNLDEETVVRGCLGDGGYIYYVEAHALLYEVVISPNMGLDSISVIGTEEEID
tara:strand:+ start:221 stop:829 length:609 start_codon:yes stop_codon:yes gene_type:complete